MNRRHLLLLLIALSALPADAAFADDGSGGGDDGGDGGSDDGGSDGGGDSGDDGGGDNSGPGGGGDDEPGDDNGGTSGKDHDSALRAVETEGALTLEEFLPHFRRQVKGRVVDVSLAKRGAALLFIVTYVDPDGRVRRRRFDARTGTLVE